MATYDLQQLDASLVAGSTPQVIRAQIEDYLRNNGYFTTGGNILTNTPWVDTELTQTNAANLEILAGANITVPNKSPLSYVFDTTAGSVLTVTDPPVAAQNVGISVISSQVLLQDSGNDVVNANFGGNTLDASGATGNDTLYGSASGSDTLIGGVGQDLLVAGAGGGLLQSGSAIGGYNILDDATSTTHTLQGGAGSDTLYAAGTGNDTLIAGSGANFLQAITGNNSLLGGTGADTLWAGAGHDTLHGGSGANLLVALGSYPIPGGGTFPGAGSGELISGSLVGGSNILDDQSATTHTLQGGAGADSLYAAGTGNDTLLAGTGANFLQGLTGNNSLLGGSGADLLWAGAGNDTLHGGSGANTLVAIAGSGSGQLISGSLGGGSNLLIDDSSTAHTLTGGLGADSLYGSSTNGGDTLISGAGNNLLQGFAGNNSLSAVGGGNDTLYAGSGNDTLNGSGGSGNNLYYTGSGNATISGGSGSNLFDDFSAVGAASATPTATIDIAAGSGTNTLNFEQRKVSDVTSDSGVVGGVRTIDFSDGKDFVITGAATVTVQFKP